MKKIYILLVMLVASLMFVSGAQAYSFCNTCDSYKSDYWEEGADTWSYDDSGYYDGGHHDGYDGGGMHDSWVDDTYGDSYSRFKDYTNAKHFTVDVDISNVGYGGLYFRSADESSGVVLVVVGAGETYKSTYYDKGGLYWYVRDGSDIWGTVKEHGYDDESLKKGDDIHLKVVADGDTYKAYIGGEYVSTYTNKTGYSNYNDYDEGYIALYDYTGQKYDNFCIENPGTVVPEPSTYLLLGSGLLGLVAWRRRQVRKG